MPPDSSRALASTKAAKRPAVWINGLLLNADAGTLLRDGAVVPLRRKAFHILCELAARAGQVVPKQVLMDRVWPDVYVTEDSLTQAVRDVRTAISDETGAVLRTVRGRGYLLETVESDPQALLVGVDALPVVAVLPFETDRLDRAGAALVDVLVDEIAAGLVRFRDIRVLSGFGGNGDLEALSNLPSVADYVVTGAAVPTEGGFLVRVRLADAHDGALVMGESFDCGAERLLAARAEIVSRIVGPLHVEIDTRPRPTAGPTMNLTAFDHYAKGMRASRSDTPESASEAVAHFRAAVEADPGFGLAWSSLAVNELAAMDYGAAPPEVFARAYDYARRGMSLAPEDSRACSVLGYVQSLVGEFAAAEANVLRGLDLNPGSFDTICDVVVLHLCRGRAQEALASLDRMAAVRTARVVHEYTLRGEALYLLGRYSEAADCFLRVWSLSPRRRAFLAAMLAQAGRDDEARKQLQLLETEFAHRDLFRLLANGYRYEHAADAMHLTAGLQKALALVG